MALTLALIAHDGKKDDIVRFAQEFRDVLSRHHLVGTGTTAELVEASTQLPVHRFKSGPFGGDVEIAAEILQGRVAAVFFFVEPMAAHPHDPDIRTLMRICHICDCPLATNPATAALVIRSLEG
jgi:methylglyoxal synthase